MPLVSWLRSARRVSGAKRKPKYGTASEYSIVSTVSPPSVSTHAAVRGERATVSGERSVVLTHLVHDVVARLEQARGWLGEAVDDAGHRLRCS